MRQVRADLQMAIEFVDSLHNERFVNYIILDLTLRSLINVQSLITVQEVTLFYKKYKVSSGLGLFPFLRP